MQADDILDSTKESFIQFVKAYEACKQSGDTTPSWMHLDALHKFILNNKVSPAQLNRYDNMGKTINLYVCKPHKPHLPCGFPLTVSKAHLV